MLRRCLGLTGIAFAFWVITSPPAFAYIDPGSTNFILQLVFGSLLGIGLAVATFWKRIRVFLTRVFTRKEQ
jgi:hypothetical protein